MTIFGQFRSSGNVSHEELIRHVEPTLRSHGFSRTDIKEMENYLSGHIRDIERSQRGLDAKELAAIEKRIGHDLGWDKEKVKTAADTLKKYL
ncbi:hypothetical protein L0Y41_03700 [bacterium]|nr:hypothetical protein [bacterium]